MSSPMPSAKPSPAHLLVPPAISLLVVGVLGLLINLYQLGTALTAPQMFKEIPKELTFAKGAVISPTLAAAFGFIFATVAGFIVVGAICMLRRKGYGFAMTGAVLAMVNVGNACCLLGLPVGIWALWILWRPGVRDSFGIS